MKIELDKDPEFAKKQSLIQIFKQEKLFKARQQKLLRTQANAANELNIEIIDPLPQQLRRYRDKFFKKNVYDPPLAKNNLKKYISEQERNLKCLRLQRVATEGLDDGNEDYQSGFNQGNRSDFNVCLSPLGSKSKQEVKESDIPKIQQFFKNQHLQRLLYENRQMGKSLQKAHHQIEQTLQKSQFLPVINSEEADTSQKATKTNKFVILPPTEPTNIEDQTQIDKIIERRHRMIVKLTKKLYWEKKQIEISQNSQSHNTLSKKEDKPGIFLLQAKKPKKKIHLKGMRSVSYFDGQKKIQVTPASKLLFELHQASCEKKVKERQLGRYIQNSLQNRGELLIQKSKFYESQTPLNDLSPSSQFKLRRLMDRKLQHRLELSRGQVSRFVEYLREIKEYHLVLNETILKVLKEVRGTLLKGKLMKCSDLNMILMSKDERELEQQPNERILENLFNMMI